MTIGKETLIISEVYGDGQGLASAISDIGSNVTHVRLLSGSYAVTDDLTVGTGITYKPERGAIATVSTTKTLTINGTVEAGRYQIFNCVGTGIVAGLKIAYPEWFGGIGDGVTDCTTAITKCLASLVTGGEMVVQAGSVYMTTGGHLISKNIKITGEGPSRTNLGTSSLKLSANAAYLLKFFNLDDEVTPTTWASANVLNGGGRVDSVLFDGNGKSVTDALIIVEGFRGLNFHNCGWWSVTGRALRGRLWWDSWVDTCRIVNVDATGTDGIVSFGSYVNVEANNCNNIHIKNLHAEANHGVYFFTHETSRFYVLEVEGKIEWGTVAPAGGPYSVFELRDGQRMSFHDITFTNFKLANGYDNIFEIGYAGNATQVTFEISRNHFQQVDTGLYGLRALGRAAGAFYDNFVVSTNNYIPLVYNGSTDKIRYEAPVNLASGAPNVGGSYYAGGDVYAANIPLQARAGAAAGIGLIDTHNLIVGVNTAAGGPKWMQDPTYPTLVKNPSGNVLQSQGGDSKVVCSIPLNLLYGYPGMVRVGVRAYSATGSGTLILACLGNGVTITNTTRTIAATYATYWWDIPVHILAALGDSVNDRFRIVRSAVAGVAAEDVYIDGIYLIPIESVSGELTLTAGAASTTVTSIFVETDSRIQLTATSSGAAADVGSATGVYVSAKTAGTSFVVTHPNNATAGKTMDYTIFR